MPCSLRQVIPSTSQRLVCWYVCARDRRDKIIKEPTNKDLYSGAPLLWRPWGPGKVSYIERCPHFGAKFAIRKHILVKARFLSTGILISVVSFKRGSNVLC